MEILRDSLSDAVSQERAEQVMAFVRRNEDGLLVAADCAAHVAPESTEQRIVLMLDMSEERSRTIARIGVSAEIVPYAEAMVLVVEVGVARRLVEEVSSIGVDKFDAAASYARSTRGMMLVVLSCDATFVGCLPRRGAEVARA